MPSLQLIYVVNVVCYVWSGGEVDVVCVEPASVGA